jgi:hypothetical protein
MGSSGWAKDNIMKPQEGIGESALYSIHVGEEGERSRYNGLCCVGPLLLLQQHKYRDTMTKKISARSPTRQNSVKIREERSPQLCLGV